MDDPNRLRCAASPAAPAVIPEKQQRLILGVVAALVGMGVAVLAFSALFPPQVMAPPAASQTARPAPPPPKPSYLDAITTCKELCPLGRIAAGFEREHLMLVRNKVAKLKCACRVEAGFIESDYNR